MNLAIVVTILVCSLSGVFPKQIIYGDHDYDYDIWHWFNDRLHYRAEHRHDAALKEESEYRKSLTKNRRRCACCENLVQFEKADGTVNDRCVICGALSRHRLVCNAVETFISTNWDTHGKIMQWNGVEEHWVREKILRSINSLQDFIIPSDIHSKEGLPPSEKWRIDPHNSTIEQINWPANSFSAIFASQILENAKDDGKALDELGRVIKQGGFLVIQTPIFTQGLKRATGYFPNGESPSTDKRRTRDSTVFRQRVESAGFICNSLYAINTNVKRATYIHPHLLKKINVDADLICVK